MFFRTRHISVTDLAPTDGEEKEIGRKHDRDRHEMPGQAGHDGEEKMENNVLTRGVTTIENIRFKPKAYYFRIRPFAYFQEPSIFPQDDEWLASGKFLRP